MYNPATDYNMTDLERLQAMFGEFKMKNVYTVIVCKTTHEIKKFYFENKEETNKFLTTFYGGIENKIKRKAKEVLACDETGHVFYIGFPEDWL